MTQHDEAKHHATDPDKLDGLDDRVSIDDTPRVVDHIAERQLCRKFDVRILPVLAIMCECSHLSLETFQRHRLTDSDLFNALDKGNIGNAETAGLSKGKNQTK
jgi:hypothetical protein